ncbi:SDR family NAD(P)-dependent oxidoreductase [Pseudooceanicola sp.]|uniref:SDR family oxidoreductase n=1 Tax=Pseudooceanicola sp. TaxID=1914328 RepID=UPI002634915E|nr:SDR family NAD(P)-dependent oxidoreductase [Pseudooceanicola sp.]MDF1855140.1 SDR family NAD(P)-dependent oxidoreductase [Pseudooceanicola sp.]
MDLGLTGRVAAVTGGGGAIGRTTAKLLAAEGAAVALLDLNLDAAADAKAWIEGEVPGAAVAIITCDVTNKASVAAAFDAVTAELGPVDVLINNAGFSRDKYMVKMAEDDWDDVHDTVLKGTFHCCRAVLPGMMGRGWGRIVNTSSMAYLGNKGQTNYSSAKAGLIGLTNALAREAGGFNITVNAVAPGLIATPRLRARPDFAKLEQRSLALTPLPRLGNEVDVAKTILYFCSGLADFITAQTIHVSGGR